MNTEEYENPLDYVNGNYCDMRYPYMHPDASREYSLEVTRNYLIQSSLHSGRIKVKKYYEDMSEKEKEMIDRSIFYSSSSDYVMSSKLTTEELEIAKILFVLDEEALEFISNKNK